MTYIDRVLRDTAGMLNAAIRIAGADSFFRQDQTLALWREQVQIAMALVAGAPEPERAQTAAAMNIAGDHLCWIVNEKEAMALPEKDFLESCRRYRNQIAEERGTFIGGFTIAELETELSKATWERDALRKQLEAIHEAADPLQKSLYGVPPWNAPEAHTLLSAINATKPPEPGS